MTRAELLQKLKALDACADAVAWIKETKPATLQDAWDTCEEPTWLIWFLHNTGADQRLLVHLACDCAETALKYYASYAPDDDRPANAIRVARRWANKEATAEEVLAANAAAWTASAAAEAANAAAEAANAAAWAANAASWAASVAAGAANAAAEAANAASWAASAAAGAASAAAEAKASAAAEAKASKRLCSLIRQRVPNPEIT